MVWEKSITSIFSRTSQAAQSQHGDQLHQKPFRKKRRHRGYRGSQLEREPQASCSQEEEEHHAGLQNCTATKMQSWSCCREGHTAPALVSTSEALGAILHPTTPRRTGKVTNVQRKVTRNQLKSGPMRKTWPN